MKSLPRWLRLWSLLVEGWVPRDDRERWREEWAAELQRMAASDAGFVDLAARAAGALPHAVALRWHSIVGELLGSDLRQAWRGLVRHPGFFALATLTLALGLGGVFAMTALVRAVFLEPLPIPDPDRVVWHWGVLPASDRASVSPPDYLDYSERTTVYEGFAAMSSSPFSVTARGEVEPTRLRARFVTADLLDVLGLAPVLGRGFVAEETEVGEPSTVLMSEAVWRSRFGGRRDVLGRTLDVDGRLLTVLGVLPSAVADLPGGDVDLWLPAPFASEGYHERRYHFLRPIARLRDGVSLELAQKELDGIAADLERAYPESNTGWSVRAVPLAEVATGPVRGVMTLFFGAVATVLLIACANVAGLLLARGSARRGEMALRAALGASRRRLLQLHLVEAALLALVAAVFGMALAAVLVRFAQRSAAAALPRVGSADEVLASPGFVLFAFGLAFALGLVFGAVPASRRDGGGVGAARRIVGGRERAIFRSRLVAVEIALSFLLLSGAFVFGRSLLETLAVDPGFRSERVVTLPVSLERGDAGRAFADRVLEEVEGLGTVESAALSTVVPMWAGRGDTYVYAADSPPGPEGAATALIGGVTPDYFRSLSIPILHGRTLRTGESGVVVVNRAFAEWMFGSDDPIGRRIVVDVGTDTDRDGLEVVGVVGDVRQLGPRIEPQREFYLPLASSDVGEAQLVVRTSGDPAAALATIRATIGALDAQQALEPARTLPDIAEDTTAVPRLQARLVGLLAGFAVVLAVVGLFGLLASLVSERRREIAVRRALGATSLGVGRWVAGQVSRSLVWGLGLGGIAVLALSRFVEGLVFGVAPLDPLSVVLAALLLATTAFLAAAPPLRRALGIDPARELRGE